MFKRDVVSPHHRPNPLPLPSLGQEMGTERSEAGEGEGFSDTPKRIGSGHSQPVSVASTSFGRLQG